MDSSVSQIWLPNSSCTLFENAFDLIWNETLELYLINDTHHTALQTGNPSVTFTFGNVTSNEVLNITLPYAAFDLTLAAPLVESPTRYFPVKRASDPSQYTLGRTFFQEAYVVTDYDRGNFSIYQCDWDPEAQARQSIVTIFPPLSELSNSTTADPVTSGGSSGLPSWFYCSDSNWSHPHHRFLSGCSPILRGQTQTAESSCCNNRGSVVNDRETRSQ